MTTKEIIPVVGMHCASCAINIETRLKKLDGVQTCEVSYASDKAKIDYDPAQVTIETMNAEIKKLGYELRPDYQANHVNHESHDGHDGHDGHAAHGMPGMTEMAGMDHSAHLGLNQSKTEKLEELEQSRRKALIVLPVALFMFVIMAWEILGNIFATPKFPIAPELLNPILLVIATPVLFWAGRIFVDGAIRFVRYRVANMDTLVGIGTISAYTYSALITLFPPIAKALSAEMHTYFDVTIVVVGFVLLGKYLEANSKLKTGAALEKLIGLQAKTALVRRDKDTVELALEQLQLGDIIIVKPGAKIAVDGEIVEGGSNVDESMVTGESIPVSKQVGSNVIGGTLNKSGSFEFKATKLGKDTTLAQIIRLVEEAQASRAPIQKLVDQISAIFVPSVLAIAAITLIVWLTVGTVVLGFSSALSLGFICFVGVLVIACPCALGLATPTAIIVGTGLGAQHGILIKDAQHLETLSKAKIVVFDKTGTLTKGKPEVTDILTFAGISEAELLATTAAIETKSEHPLAEAIVNKALQMKLELPSISKFESIEGKGVVAQIGEASFIIGNQSLMNDHKIQLSNEAKELSQQGKTAIYIARGQSLVGIIAVADTLKEETLHTIKQLQDMGLRLVMLTGDQQDTAQAIAKQIGIVEFKAEVLPADKVAVIKQLQQEGIVAMLGDGVNDAPALMQANVGVAMGTGTDVAIESAGIILLKGDLTKLLKAIRLSKLTLRTIKQNLFWAFAYNILGIPIAAGILYPVFGILLSPAIAGAAMGLSSVSVVFNSLLLKRIRL